MKKISFVMVIATSFMACKKDHPGATSNNAAVQTSKIKTAISENQVTSYTYDGQGRQLTTIFSDGSHADYEYTADLAKRKIYDAANTYLYTITYELNADGYCSRETSSNNADEWLYEYNSDKTLKKRTCNSNTGVTTFDYFYSAGNCDSIRLSGFDGNWQSTIIKTYDTGKPNLYSNENTGDNFWGKPDKNLLKSSTSKLAGGSLATTGNYAYEYDAQGNISKMTITTGNNVEEGIFTYY